MSVDKREENEKKKKRKMEKEKLCFNVAAEVP